MTRTRFAPSPTGYLHLGHAYSALFAFRAATPGEFLLRIEDIDPARCKAEYTEGIYEDLAWLGLTWQQPVRLQSRQMADYAAALRQLRDTGLLYPCFCTRGEIEAQARQAVTAPHTDDAGFIYPGTCRHLSVAARAEKLAQNTAASWRLNMTEALRHTGRLTWHDRGRGKMTAHPERFGDVVLARKEIAASYHLCVTLDDHLQNITLVTRGEDLCAATDIHRLLQALLGLNTPGYHHHALLKDAAGRRFAKRNQSQSLRALRRAGLTPPQALALLGQKSVR